MVRKVGHTGEDNKCLWKDKKKTLQSLYEEFCMNIITDITQNIDGQIQAL